MTFKSIGLVVALILATFTGLNSNTYAFNIDEAVEGFWYESNLNARRGWGFQYLRTGPGKGVFFVAGYIYDDEGNPIWVTGQAEVYDGQFETDITLQLIGGGTFAPEQGNPVILDDNVGNLNIVFKSCNKADFTFSGGEGLDFTQEFSHFRVIVGGSLEDNCVQQTEFIGCPFGIDPGTKPRSCVLRGTYTSDLVLGNHATWQLDGPVFIGHKPDVRDPVPEWGPTLTIMAGTRIEGMGETSALIISRGSRIIAQGQPHAPIVFTGPRTPDEGAAPGDWGGLVISGDSVTNTCESSSCEVDGAGGTGAYGGADIYDDSGTLSYVRVEFAGGVIDGGDYDLPCLTLQGVGSGTDVDHVQVHACHDDGIKIHGGYVDAEYLVLTHVENDSLDWNHGYRGKLQFILVIQNPDPSASADKAISVENFEDNHSAFHRTAAKVSNATLIGQGTETAIDINEGAGGFFSNIVVSGFDECLDIDDDTTFIIAGSPGSPTGVLKFTNSVFWCSDAFPDDGEDLWSIRDFVLDFPEGQNREDLNPGLDGFMPPQGADYLSGLTMDPEDYLGFHRQVDYAGAFETRDAAWHYGWTEYLPQ